LNLIWKIKSEIMTLSFPILPPFKELYLILPQKSDNFKLLNYEGIK